MGRDTVCRVCLGQAETSVRFLYRHAANGRVSGQWDETDY